MITCDKCKTVGKAAHPTSFAMVTCDGQDELMSLEHNEDLCLDCHSLRRTAIEKAIGVTLVDVSPQD